VLLLRDDLSFRFSGLGMTSDSDWRLAKKHDYLIGVTVRFKPYSKWSADWEHDHCSFCWAKFMEKDDPNRKADCLHEGYAVVAHDDFRDDYHWICTVCFDDFKEQFQWKLET
jgi:hypothetical protein